VAASGCPQHDPGADNRRCSPPDYDDRVPSHDPDDLLTDLDPAQREAVLITSGPLCILAGAAAARHGSSRDASATRSRPA
jgi:hypothetical protein